MKNKSFFVIFTYIKYLNMEHKRLQFLVPQYKEKEETIKFLLDSIECQVDIDKKDMVLLSVQMVGNIFLIKNS